MGLWLLRLTVKFLAVLRQTVSLIPLGLTEVLKLISIVLKML